MYFLSKHFYTTEVQQIEEHFSTKKCQMGALVTTLGHMWRLYLSFVLWGRCALDRTLLLRRVRE